MTILVTGGAGYIGSHTVVKLINSGHSVLVLDNLCNSKPEVLNRIETICGKRPEFIEGDVRDRRCLREIFERHQISSVIHFAGLKAVGQSVQVPLMYYDNNVSGSNVLFEEMSLAGIKHLVFSSSATVYGIPEVLPVKECSSLMPENPYGRSKLFVEEILRDLSASDPSWRIVLLRYFNPVGAHPSGLIGEDPAGIPNNLMPFVSQVAVGKREKLQVFGNDYPTPDGTGVRDYIHVEDLAAGHLAALSSTLAPGVTTVNLGTGRGHSVLEVIHAFEAASGKTITFDFVKRRPGDIATCFADPTLAERLLGWKATRDLTQMCEDAWRWQSKNPEGYS